MTCKGCSHAFVDSCPYCEDLVLICTETNPSLLDYKFYEDEDINCSGVFEE